MTGATPPAGDDSFRVGVIGCGTLGRRLALRLVRAGFSVRVHDLERQAAASLIEAGAEFTDTPAELPVGCRVLLSCLPRGEDVEKAHLGAAGIWAAAHRGTVHLETSTIGAQRARRLAEAASDHQVLFLDAPFSRGETGAAGVTLSALVGGPADVIDRARPVLDAIADKVLYCGGVGQGQVAKLVNNLVAHTLLVALGEALALGLRAGGTLDLLTAALGSGTAQSRVLDEILPATVFRGDWRPGLSLEMARKDLKLVSDLAAETGTRITFLDDLRGAFRSAADRGWDDQAAHTVIRLAEEAAGVELRSAVLQSLGPPVDPPE